VDPIKQISAEIKKCRIVVVDDEEANLKLIDRVLDIGGYTNISLINDPTTVIDFYKENGADLFLIDLNMPLMDGFEVIAALMDLDDDFLPPVLVLTAQLAQEYRQKALDVGARDFVTKPFVVNELLARVRNQLEIRQTQSLLRDQNQNLEAIVQERTKELQLAHQQLQESRLQVVRRLGRAAEYRDNETGLHIIRMSYISVAIGRAAGMDDEATDLLLNASPMHDIGKIGIPDKILLKPGKFEPEEWEIMKTHAQIGADILSGDDTPMMAMAREIALTHHEKWDGSGYPNSLQGEAIPLVGRVSALADVFDALTSERPYKKAWDVDVAIDYIKEQSGKHFDPKLVELFIENLDDIVLIKEKYMEPEE
jgi:cyclic di-GMP phosphodiesterase